MRELKISSVLVAGILVLVQSQGAIAAGEKATALPTAATTTAVVKTVATPPATPIVAAPLPAAASTAIVKTVATPADPAAVLVEVDGTKFTQGQADAILAERLARVKEKIPPKQIDRFERSQRRQIVEEFIVQTLIANAAKKQNLTVGAKDVDDYLEKIKGELTPGMTLDQVLKTEGVTMADLRKDIERQLMVKKLVEASLSGKTEPTEKEITDFYDKNKERFNMPETVKARHILIAVDQDADASTMADGKAVADSVRDDLVHGADFAKMAAVNSDCPSHVRGGDLGEFPRGQMVKAFDEAAFSQKVDDIGPVIQTQFGYHIIQVTAHNQPRVVGIEEAKPTIASYLKRRTEQDGLQTLVEKLRQDAKIVYGKEPAT